MSAAVAQRHALSAASAPPPYQVEHLCAGVTGRTLLRDLSLTVQRGEVWAILGSNGVGKTTLLHTLIGLHRADSGSIALCGRPLADWPVGDAAAVRGFLPQFIYDSFAARVIDMVLMGRHPHLSRWQWEGDDDLALAHAALEAVDLLAFAQRDVTTLSGGERQRVAIAALLAQDPLALLLDEPVAHLDLHHQITVLRHLSGLARTRDKAVVMSLHDPNLACRFATHALVMFGDATSRAGPIDTVVDTATLSAAYGHPIAEVAAGGRAVFVPE